MLLRYAVRELWSRWSRSVATVLAATLAVSSFIILTGTSERQRLEVTQLVEASARGAYDILVRPKGSTSDIESSQQIVREDYLSGAYGGITLDQVKQLRRVPGVEVAAPIAMLGVTWRTQYVPIDVGDALKGRAHALLRYVVQDETRNATVKHQSWTGYVYLTRGKLEQTGEWGTGSLERVSGKTVTVCLDIAQVADEPGSSVNDPAARWRPICQSTKHEFDFLVVPVSYPLLMAAVDPAAENQLLDVDAARTTGRSLDSATKQEYRHDQDADHVPAVMSSRLDADYQTTLRVESLPDSLIDPLFAATSNDERRKLMMNASGKPVEAPVARDAAEEFAAAAASARSSENPSQVFVSALWQTGQIRYTDSNGVLHPVEVPTTSRTWRNDAGPWYWPVPISVTDTSYRDITVKPRPSLETKFLVLDVIGQFEPTKVRSGDKPSGLLGSYSPEPLLAADPESSKVLGDRPLRSDLNPAGYVQNPPALLVSLDALGAFDAAFSGLDSTAPVSAVRIRVAGVTGVDAVSRERIRVAAEQIQQETGLDVDITLGSSVTYRTVALPATTMGTPAIQLKEAWVKKGVAIAISDALDVKSVALFCLILLSAGLTIAIAAIASVRVRRQELAILSCVGWRASRLRNLLLTEALILGLVSGVLGVVAAYFGGQALQIPVSAQKLLLAVPISCALSLVSTWAAALDAGRAAPAASLRDTSALSRRLRMRARSAVGVGTSMLVQRGRRLALGTAAVALGTAALALVLGVNWVFRGVAVGSVLGDAVAVQVQGSDVAAAVLLGVLALICVAVVLFTGTTEDARALAALRAIGWRDRAITASLVYQGAVIGFAGALVGGLIAAAAMTFVFGVAPATYLGPIAIVAVAAVVASAAAAWPVARLQAGRSIAATLAI
jgi:ABC-type antimicrobial peptide transport system permease subunit